MTGAMLGTPHYMSLEQLQGSEADARSDVYAFGVVLYECLTGVRPFAAASGLSAAARRLTEEPAPLPRDRPGLDRRWRATVRRCLERDPRDRFASAAEVAAALGRRSGERTPWSASARPATPTRRHSSSGRAAPLGGLLAAAAARTAVGPGATHRPGRPDRSRARWWRCSGLPGTRAGSARAPPNGWWLRLEAGDSILALAAGRSSEVLRETGTAIAEVAEQDVPRLGRALGAGFVMVGKLSTLERGAEPGVRLDLRLHDAGTGSVLAETTELGPEAELDAVVERAALRVREALGAAAPTAEERRAALAKLPRSTAAERDYTLGLERLRAWDAATARDHLERAIAAEPGYAIAHLRLAEAWQLLGFEGEARDATRRAFELRDPLPRAGPQLFVEARYRASSYDWTAAADIYRALVTVYPDRLDFGLRLAEIQVPRGRRRRGRASPPSRSCAGVTPGSAADPRLDLAESDAAWVASDWDRYLEAARRATGRAAELDLDGVEAKSRCYEGWGLRYRGPLDGALAAGEACRGLWAGLGNHGGEADALNFLATVHLDRGEIERASQRYREAAESYEQMGDLGGVAVAYSNLGNALYDRGDLDAAEKLYTDALALYRRVGRREGESATGTALGNVALARGELAAARGHYEETLAAARAVGSKRLEALWVNNYGNALAQGGGWTPPPASATRHRSRCARSSATTACSRSTWWALATSTSRAVVSTPRVRAIAAPTTCASRTARRCSSRRVGWPSVASISNGERPAPPSKPRGRRSPSSASGALPARDCPLSRS